MRQGLIGLASRYCGTDHTTARVDNFHFARHFGNVWRSARGATGNIEDDFDRDEISDFNAGPHGLNTGNGQADPQHIRPRSVNNLIARQQRADEFGVYQVRHAFDDVRRQAFVFGILINNDLDGVDRNLVIRAQVRDRIDIAICSTHTIDRLQFRIIGQKAGIRDARR